MKKNEFNAKMLLEDLIERYPVLEACRDSFEIVFQQLLKCFRNGKKLLCAGNGGSAADCEHIAGELLKSFRISRPVSCTLNRNLKDLFGDEGAYLAARLEGGLPVIPLTSMSAIHTAYANDVDSTAVFAQLVHSLGQAGDVFLGITTSGNSKNILFALMTAKAQGMTTICLTGRSGGQCKILSDISICAPEDETFKIQELHLPIYHTLCSMLEAELFQHC